MEGELRVIQRLLVANRGEIACRIFRTARDLGIRTIAVFSDADAAAQHVKQADEAVRIGPAPPRESYLDIQKILDAARATQADAIHPGYGFLSENAEFARAVVDAGLIYVGPPAAAVTAMGSKIVAKARMRARGVPVLPGYEGVNQDLAHLQSEARRLGMPLIIKPAAGGGGKGMRIVRNEAEIPEALAAARRLAESGFGDGSLLLERYLAAPRHVEVQIFADAHGNFVHLGDRDCSIQRRHQKLIEEAPAPELPDDLRARLRAAAIVVAREIGYVGAGTVEFLFDGREFYFMEMNTRLQVEHTVTELITGIDLVEWQLDVAEGAQLPLAQSEIKFYGHAMEARICAEDPERDFLPSAGDLRLLEWPTAPVSARVDAGFSTGDRVPESYDSLLGKVICWGPTRTEAAGKLAGALDRIHCAGVRTNERWLARILQAPEFLRVEHSIAWLESHAKQFADQGDVARDRRAAVIAALAVHPAPAGFDPWASVDGFTPNLPAAVQFAVQLRGQQHAIAIEQRREHLTIVVDGMPVAIANVLRTEGEIAAILEGVRLKARVFVYGIHVHVWVEGQHHDFVHEDPRDREFSASATGGGLTTPLPGLVVAVKVTEGQTVAAGEVLMVIEAMKMEHAITAPHAGTVQAVHFAAGDRVSEGSALLELTAASGN
jgi:3-methylcrotonyl-CoA carboxylase alpha subunit